ncbi:MAG: hypothetical protein IJW99_03770 [Clostridia bacterium]|nr:hypothetical protein [Clostridia bacterium]
MKFKKLLVVLLAVVMTAALLIPASAAEQDISCCDEPWLENPEYVYGGIFRILPKSHVFPIHAIYDCSHCGGRYIEENIDFYAEEHYGDQDVPDQEGYYYCDEPSCGAIFSKD